jgi:CPA2 family monovalent cation:H+ antiporter-2
LGFEALASVYLGFAVSASSTLVVTQHLRQQGQMFQPFGRLVTGVLLLQDLAIVVVFVILHAVPEGALNVGLRLAVFSIAAAAAAWAHFKVIPWLLAKFHSEEETLLLVGLATLFLALGASFILQLPLVAGAFLAGFALAAFPVNGLLRGLLGSLSSFFMAVFFTALGMLVQIPDWRIPVQALALAAVIVLLTPVLVSAIVEFTGLSTRTGIESGLLLAQSSELGIVLGLAGVSTGQLSMNEFSVLALVAGLTMTLTPLIATDQVTWRLMHWHPGRKNRSAMGKFSDHVLILGFGNSGMWVVKALQDAGHRIVVVDDDSVVIEDLALLGIPCLRGDGSDERLLKYVGADRAKWIIASLPRLPDLLKVIRTVKGVPVVARVFEDSEAAAIRRAGGLPILNSEASVDAFLAWFDNFSGPLATTSTDKPAPTKTT